MSIPPSNNLPPPVEYTQKPPHPVVYNNTNSDHINITEEKAKIILMKNIDNMNNRDAWKTSLGFFVTFITVLATTEPKEGIFGLSTDQWKAIFSISTVLCGVWFFRNLFGFFSSSKSTPEKIVSQLKGQNDIL